ncbi:MAG: SpoIVB peptidase S55 domain-containing protein [bacterium]|nr:SpoIVB peptidase S55 domain-containing protein [bacterium]
MKRVKIIAFLLLLGTPVLAGTEIMPLKDIRPGMKGYGLSVFKGVKIERFDVEIITVSRKTRPRSGMIWARISGHPDIEKAGVIAGMSGSPVYINNKLIGALAFSGSFLKEALAGITPIEDMLDILKKEDTRTSSGYVPPPEGKQYASSDGLRSIKVPLVIGNGSENLVSLYRNELEQMNFIPMTADSYSNFDQLEIPRKFEPGSAVGIYLMTGDLTLSGIGTVTYTNGNKVLVFGHPMHFSGGSDCPLAHAYIHTVIPGLDRSFKMGTSTKIVGRTYQDQLAGVAGVLNQQADMLPVQVNYDFFNTRGKYNYHIIRNNNYLPNLLSIAVYSALEMLGSFQEKNTLDFTFEITLDKGKKLEISNTMSSLTTADSLKNSMQYLLTPLANLLNNKFENVRIENVKADIGIKSRIHVAEIKKIIAPKRAYHPGETVELKVKLKPYRGEEFYRNISIQLPANLEDKKFTLIVSSDPEREYVDYLLSPQKYNPQSLEQLIRLYNSLPRATDLAVWSVTKDKGVVINGEIMNKLPGSYYSILQDSLDSSSDRSLMQIKNKIPVDYIVVGACSLTLEIKNPNE